MPYSIILAILALLSPSERGSLKPILMFAFPLSSMRTGESPRDFSSSPVERESVFVSLPITDERLLLTFARTTSPPALSAFSQISSVLSPSRDSFKRKSSGILTSTLATGFYLLCKHFNIHISAFYILNRCDFKFSVVAKYQHIGCNLNIWNTPKTKQVGSG